MSTSAFLASRTRGPRHVRSAASNLRRRRVYFASLLLFVSVCCTCVVLCICYLTASSEEISCHSAAAKLLTKSTTRRAVVLAPGVPANVYIRILTERISGYQSVATGRYTYCMHNPCADETLAMASFIDAQYVAFVDSNRYERVVVIVRDTLNAVYTEAMLANAVNDKFPNMRISRNFVQAVAELYANVSAWTKGKKLKIVQVEDLVRDMANNGKEAVWSNMIAFLLQKEHDEFVAVQQTSLECAFNENRLKIEENALRIMPNMLKAHDANASRFSTQAWDFVQSDLRYHTCVYGYSHPRERCDLLASDV